MNINREIQNGQLLIACTNMKRSHLKMAVVSLIGSRRHGANSIDFILTVKATDFQTEFRRTHSGLPPKLLQLILVNLAFKGEDASEFVYICFRVPRIIIDH